jgi:bifunctional DNA-binding transcriptional regulator/antitoxin component of YhaV-PrlF toxin-antitoxin module
MAKAKDIVPKIGFVAAFIFICVYMFFYARERIANRQGPGAATPAHDKSSKGGTRPGGTGANVSPSRSTASGGTGATGSSKTGSSTHGETQTAKPARKVGGKPLNAGSDNESGKPVSQSYPGRKRKVVRFRERDNLPRGTISGIIKNSTGNPVAGAQLGLFHTSLRGKPKSETRSNANGHYTIGPCRTGRYALHVSAENHAPLTEPVEITASETKRDITLRAGVTLTGTVITLDNAGMAVTVTAERPGWREELSIKTGEKFEFHSVPRGDVIIKAESPSYVRAETRITVNSDEGEISAGTLILYRGATVSGTVTDETTGNGIPQAAVLLEVPGERNACSAVADKDGNFLLNGAPAGKAFNLTFSAPGYTSKITWSQALSTGEKKEINVSLTPAPIIRGRVETWDRIPIEQALVTMYAESGNITRSVPGRTDASGGFSFSVPQGMSVTDTKFSLHAGAYGFAPSIVRIEPGKENESIVISLGPGCGLEGTVLGPGGSPVELASIRALRKDMDPKDALRLEVKTRSGREGKYELTAMGKGAWNVVFSYGTGAPQILDITFKEAGEKKEIDIALKPGWRFEGTVTEADGKPVPGVNALLTCENSYIEPQRTTSDSNGKFSFSGLGDYDYSLILSRTCFESIEGEAVLQTSPTTTFILKERK